MQKGGNITINFNGTIEKLKIKMDGSDFAFDLQEGAAKPVMASKEALGQVAATKEDVLEGEAIAAPMPGKVFKVVCAEGVKVEKGEQILILEAMKMENEIKAPMGGIVQKIHVQEGDAVNPGDVLVIIKREE